MARVSTNCCLYCLVSSLINAVMARIFGFSWADAGVAKDANKKTTRKMVCARNGKTCAERALLRNIWSSSKVSGNPRNAFADDQAMDVMRALVSVDRFEIVHVAHNAVIVDDAVGPQNVPRLASGFHGHPHVVHLQHGDVGWVHLVLVFSSAHMQRQQLRF